MHCQLAKIFIIVTKHNDPSIFAECCEHDVPEPGEVLPHAVHVGRDPEPEVAGEGDDDRDHVRGLCHVRHHPLRSLTAGRELLMGRQSEHFNDTLGCLSLNWNRVDIGMNQEWSCTRA